MTLPGPIDHEPLLPLLPEGLVGTTTRAVPVHGGLSGATVHAITTTRGEYILRVTPDGAPGRPWEHQLGVLRRVAGHGIAPAVVHVDEAAHAVLSVRAAGSPLPAALGNAAQRDAAIGGTVGLLRALHALDASDIARFDVVGFAREAYASQCDREGFPAWAAQGHALLDAVGSALARDRREVLSHNDVNPGNVLWDGARAWLVDWDAAGLTHPYYDLATLTTFLALDLEGALGLLALQEGAPATGEQAATFALLRRLVALAAGCMFLSRVRGALPPARSRDETPSLLACHRRMREGSLHMRQPEGSAMMGHALLRAFAGPDATQG